MADQIQQEQKGSREITVFALDGVTVRVEREMDRSQNLKPKSDYPRVFVFESGETVMEDLMNRRNRPVDVYRAVAEAALAALGFKDPGLKWSQKAGCTCPCSPGFIGQGDIGGHGDVFITVTKQNRLPGLAAVLSTVGA
jgi:hypothetical protein